MHPATVPDTITVTEQTFEEIRSTGADVLIAVSERSLGGRSSGRVAAVRARLGELGFAEGDVMLQGVQRGLWAWIAIPFAIGAPGVAVVAKGDPATAVALFAGFVLLYAVLAAMKVGTVTASLEVRCAGAEGVSRLLDAVLDSREAEVQQIAWRYDVDAGSQAAWVTRAVARASERAARIASALGVRIAGVHAFREEHLLPQAASPRPVEPLAREEAVRARKGRGAMSVAESVGAASNTERAGVTVTIEYRVGPLDASGA